MLRLRAFRLTRTLAGILFGTGLLWTNIGHAQNNAVAPTPAQIPAQVEQAYAQLMGAPQIQRLLDAVKTDHARTIDDLTMLTQIEAPPFKEQKRAQAFLSRMKELGLPDAAIDSEGNVVGLRKGAGSGPLLVISAHLDTVFPSGTDVSVKKRDTRLYAPGISDDVRGLSVLLSWLKVLNDNDVRTVGDLLIVGNVGEGPGRSARHEGDFSRPSEHRRHGRSGAIARR
jgi:tripeptide aminopeptidase